MSKSNSKPKSDDSQDRQEPVRHLPDGKRDWGGRGRSSAEQSDHDERQAGWGKQLRAAWYSITGDAPILGPNDRAGAQSYLDKLSRAIARGHWTKNEWNRLRAAHLKWHRRANGLDPYFEAYGNRRQWADHGRTAKSKEDKAVIEAVNRIKEIVKKEVVKMQRAMPEETPREKIKRLEAVDNRHTSSDDFEGQD